MKKTCLTIICIIFFGLKISGQDYRLLPMNDLYKDFYNPAFTAYTQKTGIYGIGNSQYSNYNWPGVHGEWVRDRYYILGISTPFIINEKQSLGVGLNYSKQHYGMDHIDDIRLKIAYHHDIGKSKFMIGGNMDVIRNSADYRFIDPSIPATTTQTDISYNAGIGIAYQYTPSNFYFGFSVNHLSRHKIIYDEIAEPYYTYYPIYNWMTGIDIKLGKHFILKPSISIYYKHFTSCIPDISATLKDHYQMGIFYNSLQDQWGARIGYKSRNIGIHYAYSLPPYSLIIILSGAHTLGLTFQLNRKNNFRASTFNKLLPIKGT
jgi:type IX secretion system PorP/SprF family membrane protein